MVAPTSTRRRRKATTTGARKRAAKPVGYQAMVRLVPQRPMVDMGVFDTTASVVVSNTGSSSYMNNIVLGTGQGNRIGDRIMMRGIYYKLQVGPLATQNGDQGVRILLVYDKQCNGAGPTAPLPLASATYDAYKNADYRERFVILKDWLIGCGGFGQAFPGSLDSKHSNIQTGYIKCELPTQYNASAGAITDCVSGSLLFFFIGNVASTGTNTPGVNYSTRVLFEK